MTLKYKHKLAQLKAKEHALKNKTNHENSRAKKETKLAKLKIKRAKKVAQQKFKHDKKHLLAAKRKAQRWEKYRSSLRDASSTKLAHKKGSGWNSFQDQAYDAIDKAMIKPGTPIFAPGMTKEYNKLVGKYVFLLSYALPSPK